MGFSLFQDIISIFLLTVISIFFNSTQAIGAIIIIESFFSIISRDICPKSLSLSDISLSSSSNSSSSHHETQNSLNIKNTIKRINCIKEETIYYLSFYHFNEFIILIFVKIQIK
jgi:hypothetical protein